MKARLCVVHAQMKMYLESFLSICKTSFRPMLTRLPISRQSVNRLSESAKSKHVVHAWFNEF